MISYATKEMVPKLSELWYACFHDEEPYRSFYYDHFFLPEETLVYIEDGKLAAMLTLLQAEQIRDNRKVPVRYVYAVATDPKYRNRGYAKALLAYANSEKARTEGVSYETTFLVPASHSLFGYYERLGYTTQYYIKTARFHHCPDIEHTNAIQSMEMDAEELYKFRNQYFASESNILWPVRALQYMIREIEFTGGWVKKLQLDGNEYAAVYYVNKDELIVKEICAPDAVIPELIRNLMQMTKTSTANVRLRPDSAIQADLEPFGMAYHGEKNRCFYFNLALD